jgi:hypothetical protein
MLGLEHLASTDRGVIMMRNMIRRGIRAVRDGESLGYRVMQNATAVPTYSHTGSFRVLLRPRRRQRTGNCCARSRAVWSRRR